LGFSNLDFGSIYRQQDSCDSNGLCHFDNIRCIRPTKPCAERKQRNVPLEWVFLLPKAAKNLNQTADVDMRCFGVFRALHFRFTSMTVQML
jgi:hypothetical protein